MVAYENLWILIVFPVSNFKCLYIYGENIYYKLNFLNKMNLRICVIITTIIIFKFILKLSLFFVNAPNIGPRGNDLRLLLRTFVAYQKVYYSSICFKYFIGNSIFYGDLKVLGSIVLLFSAIVHLNIIPFFTKAYPSNLR